MLRPPVRSMIFPPRSQFGPVLARLTLLALAVATVSCSALSRLKGAGDPLLGRWHETAWIDCATGQEEMPNDPIRELAFQSDGTVTVTWHPIETYVDYRGTYESSELARMEIVMTWSAYAPGDFDGVGTYEIDDGGDLVLADMWLGSPKQTQGLNGCGHRFERVE
jgi:hypothetical protein